MGSGHGLGHGTHPSATVHSVVAPASAVKVRTRSLPFVNAAGDAVIVGGSGGRVSATKS